MDKNQKWLMNEVRERTGMYMDSSYLSKLMTGRATSTPMCGIVYEILGIKEGK